jgi:PIN domain nuclease of toxin-antitoxin system
VRVLLDTHALLWWIEGTPELGPHATESLTDGETDALVSMASCWEIGIKVSLGKLKLPSPLGRFLRDQFALNGFSLLEVDFTHAVRVAALPFHHRDPFDRLLAAQCLEEQISMVSADGVFEDYGVHRLW